MSVLIFVLVIYKMRYTDEEKSDMLRIYYQNGNNACAARREYSRIFPHREVPDRKTFSNIERRFRQQKSVHRKKRVAVVNENEEINILLFFQGNIYLLTLKPNNFLNTLQKTRTDPLQMPISILISRQQKFIIR